MHGQNPAQSIWTSLVREHGKCRAFVLPVALESYGPYYLVSNKPKLCVRRRSRIVGRLKNLLDSARRVVRQPHSMGLKLNLGCGRKYLAGYLNCDVSHEVRADRYFDLNSFPYPFESNCADEILMDNVLEHLDDIPAVMAELHRILKPGGRLRILVPYGKSDWALQDPTHKHFFTEQSFNYFVEGNPYNFYSKVRFRLVRARLYGDKTTWRHRLRNLLPFKAVLRYFLFNIYDGIDFELEKTSTEERPH